MTLTMRQIEREAEQYIRDLYARLGIDRPVPPARLGAQLGAKARANVNAYLDSKCRRREYSEAEVGVTSPTSLVICHL